jgi:D-amino peptidase
MHQLTREVNACVAGIHSVDKAAEVGVWDGHGSGGLFAADVVGAEVFASNSKPHTRISDYDALLFVGQHAMAGTPFAPLCHTFSSLTIAYYRLNGIFIGEFGFWAFFAGSLGVPTIFLAGDDKAALEAQMLIPEIETAAVKWGKGWEAAVHRSSEEACTVVQAGAAQAVRRMKAIPPLIGLKPPYRLEIRYYNSFDRAKWAKPGVTVIDDRTLVMEADTLPDLVRLRLG